MILLTVLTMLSVLLLVAVLWIGLVRIYRLLEDIGGATTSTPTSLLARIRWGVRAIEQQTTVIEPQAHRLAAAIAALGEGLGELQQSLLAVARRRREAGR